MCSKYKHIENIKTTTRQFQKYYRLDKLIFF